MMYEFANALARRGHEVHFVHGPKWPTRVERVEDLPFCFHEGVRHHIVDALDDPSLPDGDVVFTPAPARLGQQVVLVQGFRLIGAEWDRDSFRALAPKVCVASWLVDVGHWFGVPGEQLVHVPMGLDHELFAVRTPLHERSIDVAMLYHPSREKGWDVALPALRELVRRRPGLRAVVFSLAGPPPEALPDGVRVVLDLDQRRLADEVYNAARVVVQASHHEGFGLTAVEAMACGAALVTTDCGGSRDYALPGETAFVVAAGDSLGLAERSVDLLVDDARRVALAAAGAHYVRRFNWDRSGEALEAFLDRYLADPASFQRPPGEDRSEEYTL
jgi:glycosyltransferase involved in cell wall biosynthesis